MLLFLLFSLAIYEFITAGLPVFAIVCLLPLAVLFIYVAFKWRMFVFWILIVVNYFIQWHDLHLPIPISLPNEMLQLLLLGIAIIDSRETPHFKRCGNIMLLAIVIWWKQQNIGLTPSESSFLYGRGASTHIIQGGTLIRYFSTFSDAANYGCNAAGAAVAFFIFGITTKFQRDRWLFLIIACAVAVCMFASGTRTAIFCMLGGLAVYVVLSKSIKIAVPSAIFGILFFCFLAFTNIANGNQQIRRMRSAFNKNDA